MSDQTTKDVLISSEEIKLFRLGEKALGTLLIAILISAFGWMWSMNSSQAEQEIRLKQAESNDQIRVDSLKQLTSEIAEIRKETNKLNTTVSTTMGIIQTKQLNFEKQIDRLGDQQSIIIKLLRERNTNEGDNN